MAYTQLKKTKKGEPYYIIQVSRGRGKSPYSTRWYVPDGLSQRSIERELNKYATSFERDCNEGLIKTKAEQKEEKRLADIENMKVKTIQQYGEQVFIPNKIKDGIESKTISYYNNILRCHVYNMIGDFLICDVQSADLKKLLFSQKKKNGDALGKSALRGVYIALNQLFQMAYEDDSISSNPMGKVKLPKNTKGEIKNRDVKFLTEEQLNVVNECINKDLIEAKSKQDFIKNGTSREYKEALWHRAFVILLMETGCRCGEICGLKWKSVDFKNNEITIENNVVYTKEFGLEETSPKGKRARTIPFYNNVVINTLKEIQDEQIKSGRLSAYCFPQYDLSMPRTPQSVTRYMQKFERKHNLAFHIHPHLFRHTLATRLEKCGVDVATISQICGHADVSTTLNMYVHSNKEDMRKGMAKLNNIIEYNNQSSIN